MNVNNTLKSWEKHAKNLQRMHKRITKIKCNEVIRRVTMQEWKRQVEKKTCLPLSSRSHRFRYISTFNVDKTIIGMTQRLVWTRHKLLKQQQC